MLEDQQPLSRCFAWPVCPPCVLCPVLRFASHLGLCSTSASLLRTTCLGCCGRAGLRQYQPYVPPNPSQTELKAILKTQITLPDFSDVVGYLFLGAQIAAKSQPQSYRITHERGSPSPLKSEFRAPGPNGWLQGSWRPTSSCGAATERPEEPGDTGSLSQTLTRHATHELPEAEMPVEPISQFRGRLLTSEAQATGRTTPA